MASVNAGEMHPETGHYPEMTYFGIEDVERASEIKRALFRSAGHMGVSMRAEVEQATDGSFQVRYNAVDKAKARAWLIQTYGPDRQNWPYNPRARSQKGRK